MAGLYGRDGSQCLSQPYGIDSKCNHLLVLRSAALDFLAPACDAAAEHCDTTTSNASLRRAMITSDLILGNPGWSSRDFDRPLEHAQQLGFGPITHRSLLTEGLLKTTAREFWPVQGKL